MLINRGGMYMKILLAGAFGKLGSDILKTLGHAGHDVVAADLVTREITGIAGKYTPLKVVILPTSCSV